MKRHLIEVAAILAYVALLSLSYAVGSHPKAVVVAEAGR